MGRLGTAQLTAGWVGAMGIEIVGLSEAAVELRLRAGPEHLQPAGLVHGGVFSGVIETACSLGALESVPEGHSVVGVENHTSFVRPLGLGAWMHCRAIPIHKGRRSQLWQADVRDERQRLVASGRVRLFCVPIDGGAENAANQGGRSGEGTDVRGGP